MTKKLELYKCNVCNQIIEVVLEGEGTLVCCGQDMELVKAGTTDGKKEAHVPVVEVLGSTKVVKVGTMPHPMEKEHYIQFIECISNDNRYIKRKYLFPDEEPEMILKCMEENDLKAREYCNIHGLFSNKEEQNG